ncbi:hypothetical protein [Streptomyces griseus]|uniref:hypothetical protein n=1 Tax=Streptomyces griseus TaxID=1911 RepID=UPI000A3975A6|nr:hypothetical protein [Streptomyces fimicarius]
MTPDEFQREMTAALRSPGAETVSTVQIEDGDGLHVMFYAPEGDDQYADGGTLFVPRAVLES